jgi:hypothetical protein
MPAGRIASKSAYFATKYIQEVKFPRKKKIAGIAAKTPKLMDLISVVVDKRKVKILL